MGSEAQDFLQVAFSPLRILSSIVFGFGEEIVLKLLGQGGGETLNGGISLIHSSRCSISLNARRDDISR